MRVEDDLHLLFVAAEHVGVGDTVDAFGTIALFAMPMQLTPEVQTPTINIRTRWPGASPREVEREIVQEQEEQLAAIEGLVKMTSRCRDSSADITLEFAVGTDIEDAMMRVNTRLQQVREYPIDAQRAFGIEVRQRIDDPVTA